MTFQKINGLHRIPHFLIRFLQQSFKFQKGYGNLWSYIKTIKYLPLYLHERIFPKQYEKMPWLNYEIISFIKKQPKMEVIEFGSGGSTLWFARNNFFILSIEHSLSWKNQVYTWCKDENLSSLVDLHYVHADPNKQNDAEKYLKPFHQRKIKGPFCILVDGIFRNQCLLACLPLIQSGAIMILHDSNREEYQEAIQVCAQSIGIEIKKIFGPGYGTPDFTHAIIFKKT